LPSVVEPALEGDKSGSSATDEKTESEDEDEPETTETEGEDGETSEDPPGEPEEAKVGNLWTSHLEGQIFLSSFLTQGAGCT